MTNPPPAESAWRTRLEKLVCPQPTATAGLFHAGRGPGIRQRIFGGQLVAQALSAACQMEDAGRQAHALHGSFLRAGERDLPVDYQVETLVAGRAFARRQVMASQQEKPIFTLIASFHRPEDGPAHQAEMPACPSPEEADAALRAWLPTADEAGRRAAGMIRNTPVEIVAIDPEALYTSVRRPPHAGWWMRLRHPVAADGGLSRALLAYVSDLMLLRNAMLPHGIRPFTDGAQSASLDHAVWFHETPDLNDWLLFDTGSDWAGHARGLSHARIFTRSGRLVATVMQESLMRLPPTPAAG